jgi:hypothetical protein
MVEQIRVRDNYSSQPVYGLDFTPFESLIFVQYPFDDSVVKMVEYWS